MYWGWNKSAQLQQKAKLKINCWSSLRCSSNSLAALIHFCLLILRDSKLHVHPPVFKYAMSQLHMGYYDILAISEVFVTDSCYFLQKQQCPLTTAFYPIQSSDGQWHFWHWGRKVTKSFLFYICIYIYFFVVRNRLHYTDG